MSPAEETKIFTLPDVDDLTKPFIFNLQYFGFFR